MKLLDPTVEGGEQLRGTFLEESPEDARRTKVYLAGLSDLLYNKDTKTQVFESIKSGPPEKSVPNTAMVLNSQMERQVTEKGSPPALSTKINANLFLVSELVEMGNAGGLWALDKEQMTPIFQETLKQYIHKGIKEKTIDPIELQGAMEGLLTEEQKQQGLQAAQARGIPAEPGVSHAMEKYASDKLHKQESKHQSVLRKMQQQQAQGQRLTGGGNPNGQ